MPTTSLGITFPCASPVVNPTDFATYATTVEAAISATAAQVTPLIDRDFVIAGSTTPNIAVNVNTTVSWNTPTAANNPSGLFNPASPTLFTIQTAGSYLVTLSVAQGAAITTGTSLRGAVLLDGTEKAWAKWPSDGTNTLPAFTISGHLISATVGQQVTATMLWTGTGGPTTPNTAIRICKISDL